MPESNSKQEQERFEWYQVNKLLLDIGRTGADLHLDPTDIVHIGGTANFYRAYQAFGSMAVANFRGTHDMDLVCFNRGSVQRLMDVLKTDPESQIDSYSIGNSASLVDKRSLYLKLNRESSPGTSTGFEIDVYDSTRNIIRFNQRIFTRDRLILDPPETLDLQTLSPGKDRGLVTVPSLRDAFIIKMDVMDFSRSGLRIKDKIDAFSTLAVCEKLGCDFQSLLDAVVSTSLSKDSAKIKMEALRDLFADPTRDLHRGIFSSPLMPNQEQIDQALVKVGKTLDSPAVKKSATD